jgi:hypothetical protein
MEIDLLKDIFLLTGKKKYLCFWISIIIALFFSSMAWGQGKLKDNDNIETVSFCEIIQTPKDFAEKKIRLKAIFRFGYEWSELFCLNCKGRIWLEYGDSFDNLTKSSIRKKVKWSEKGKTVNIVAVGKLYISGRYGHLGGYKYKFVTDYIEEAEVILNDSPSILPLEIQSKATCNMQK